MLKDQEIKYYSLADNRGGSGVPQTDRVVVLVCSDKNVKQYLIIFSF